MLPHPLQSVHDAFADLPDPRGARTKEHHLLAIVAIAISAVLCGADSWVAIEEFGTTKQGWLRTVLGLPNAIPSHDPFGRVFAALAAEQFQQGFLRWVRAAWPSTAGEMIAVDGTPLRGSHAHGIGKQALPLVRAWAGPARLGLAQRKVDATANEITAIPEVLQMLELAGCPVTVDALGCHTTIATQIVQQGAHAVLAVKANQEQLPRDIAATFQYAEAANWRGVRHAQVQPVEGAQGRIETRPSWLMADPEGLAYLNPKGVWPSLSAIGMTRTERHHSSVADEQRDNSVSGRPSVQAFADAVRGHWGIENWGHWVLEVTFDEDRSRVRPGNAPPNFAVLRHMALNLLRQEPSKGSIKTKRFRAALDEHYLRKVLQP